MKALVTGGTGFIGANIILRLLREGISVRALVRQGADKRNIAGLDIEICEGNLLDESSLNRGLEGCELVFHAAADYRLWTRDPAAMYAVNVTGTRNLLAAALRTGASRVVYTSSVGTLGNPGNGAPGREDTPVTLADMPGNYKKSKFMAEREAETFLQAGLPLVIVNPTTPVGPYDIKPTPTGRIIVDFMNGKMPAYLDTGLNLIDVDECARGHLLAAQKGRIGEKYILGGANISLCELFAMLEEITGITAPKFRLPYYPVLMAAWLNAALSRITGKEPLIPLEGVQMAAKFMYFDSSKAEQELGLERKPVKDALLGAVRWFRANGYVQRR
jgi:dihydroflavonol-4-reductase